MELDPEVVTPEAFSTLLDMIYTSTLTLGPSNVMDVLLAASHLHLNAVVKACKLHLSKKNFPSAPPKGWRSMQTLDSAQQKRATIFQQVTSGLEEDSEEDAVVEVSQSGGVEDTASSSRQKRKADETLSIRKKSCTGLGEIYKECSPTVSRSLLSAEDNTEDLLSPDGLRLPDRLWESPGEEEDEIEEKYEAAKGDSDEIQLPSQSDSSLEDICNWDKVKNHEDNVVKVKIGQDEEHEGPLITMVEVKRENINSPELETTSEGTFKCLVSTNQPNYDQMTSTSAAAEDNTLQTHLCADMNSDDKDSEETGNDPVGLDSLSDLAFSCFLNPSAESVIGSLEEEDSLASLTAAATAAAAASDASVSVHHSSDLCLNDNQANSSSAQSSDSSLGFPSVPLQQLVPTQSSGFSDTLILQPTPAPLTGYLNSLGPGLTLEASVVQPSSGISKSRSVGSSVKTAFRRIAPKVPPGSQASVEASGEALERPSLTKASEDVLSKCKKAAAEDHVLLVEGDKKYACKICCKTFMNLTDCKKHIRVHTGEKPYPCPKCGKRFSQSSHLYKHTKNSCQNWKDEQAFSDSLTT